MQFFAEENFQGIVVLHHRFNHKEPCFPVSAIEFLNCLDKFVSHSDSEDGASGVGVQASKIQEHGIKS